MTKKRTKTKLARRVTAKSKPSSVDIRIEDTLSTVDWELQFAFVSTMEGSLASVMIDSNQRDSPNTSQARDRAISEDIEDDDGVYALQIRQAPRLILGQYSYQRRFVRWNYLNMFSTDPAKRKIAGNLLKLCGTRDRRGPIGRYREVEYRPLLNANDHLREYCRRLFACACDNYEKAKFRALVPQKGNIPVSDWPSQIIEPKTGKLTESAREHLVSELRRAFPECDRLAAHGAAPHDIVDKTLGIRACGRVAISYISEYTGLHRDQINTLLKKARNYPSDPVAQSHLRIKKLTRLWKKYGPPSFEPATKASSRKTS